MLELTQQYQKIATGGSQSFNGVIGYLELWAKYNSNDSNNNTTNYSVQLRLVVSGGYIGNYMSTPWAIGGDIRLNGDAGSGSHASKTLGTATGTVTHEPDGTKTVSMNGNINFSAWGMSLSVNGSATLPTLHTPPVINEVTVSENNATLTNAGVSDDTFVRWLSNKSFAFSTTTYDEADVVEYEVANVGISLDKSNASPVSINFANINLYGNEQNRLTAFEYYVTDNKNGIGSLSQTYDFIPYFKPTFINTETKVRRQGQTSGKAILNANGSFYNATIGTLSPSCKIYFKYWVKNEEEPSSYNEVPSTSVIINDNAFTINDYLLGNDFDYQKSYYVKVYVQDGFYSSEVLSLNVPVGEATWTEYKDRVDFKKATIQGKEVAIKDDAKQNYSTKEQVIGTWIDGKPIYRKVVSFTTGSSAGDLDIPHGISNFEHIINAYGYTHRTSDNECRLIPSFYRNSDNNLYAIVIYLISATKVQLSYGSQRTNMKGYIVLEYTKTID